MPVAYPLDLRTVIRASKSREQPASFRMVEPRRGYGYAEKTGTDVPVFWTVAFRFTQAEAATFRAWFIYGIDRGANEFTLPIRTEFGLVTYTVRFLPESLLSLREDGEVFEYSATIMARSEYVPSGVELFRESWDASFGLYVGSPGGPAIPGEFTIVDSPEWGSGMLNCAAYSGGPPARRIERDVGLMVGRRFSAKFRMTATGSDDAALLSLFTSGSQGLALNPRRETAFDASRRPTLLLEGTTYQIAPAGLSNSIWYRFDLVLTSGAGMSTSTITRLDTGAVVHTMTLSGSHSPLAFDTLTFDIDSGTGTSPTQYDDLIVST